MTHRIKVGDPATSSLSSCLRSFPGGFSLITETGLLRPYLVSHEGQQQGSGGAGSATVIAATPLRLSAAPPEGSFPLDKDIPFDHAWSSDGRLLVVLRWSSFTAFWRESWECLAGSTEGGKCGDGADRSAAILTPSLGLVEQCTTSTRSEGKVVACCLLGETKASSRGGNLSGLSSGEKHNALKYLIAIGGTFGIDCYSLEATPTPPQVDADPHTRKHDRQRQHQQLQHKQQRKQRQKASSRKSQVKANGLDVKRSEAIPCDVQRRIAVTGKGFTTGCQHLTSLFYGYRVVSITISPDSALMAAAAMTGHVKVWDINLIGPVPPSPTPPERNKGSMVRRRDGRWKNDSNIPSQGIQTRQYGRDSDVSEIWGETLSMARPTSLSFSPDDKASFALACWNGSVAIFLSTHSNVGVDNDKLAASGDGRSWKRVWRETTSPATVGGNLEDQDGTFLCWCKGYTDESPATLAVSSYKVEIGACVRSSSHELPLFRNKESGTRDLLQCSGMTGSGMTAPGFEMFEDALGERVGGAVLDPLGPGAVRSAVERYLIHGLAADRGIIAMYDSNLCLHVMSISMLFGAGRIKVVSDGQHYPRPGSLETGRETVFEEKKEPIAPLTRKLTLVNNDHGLVVAKIRLHYRPEDHRVDDDSPGGLRLSVIWRDAKTGEETTDHGGLGAVPEAGEFARLPFLPSEIADGDEQQGGVFGADIRYGHLALFTRYVTLIYTRPDSGSSCDESSKSRAGSWETYATYPLVHGVLLGGASTVPPLRISDPPADLAELYLLAVLETEEGGSSPVIRIQSLRDRSVKSRCGLDLAYGSREASLGGKSTNVHVHVSPGSGGGTFVVVTDGGAEACAVARRGTFDEATLRLELAPPQVITSSPWPPPETLRLEGVAGPNCELFLFKDVGSTCSKEAANCDRARWWITWPEMELWKYVDAPVYIGGEHLSACDFIKIFQVDMESMSQPAAGDARSPLH